MVEFGGLIICVPLYTLATLLLGAGITAGLFVFHVAVVPLIFKYSKTFRRSLIFANFVQWPLNVDYEDPSSCGIEGGRNFSIEYHSKVDKCPIRIGIWHILPKTVYERLKGSFHSADKDELNRIMDEELAKSKTPIMMYCHGNSNSRAATHRIKLYKFFQQMDFHTIAFDYRGYGDSTNLNPSEDGVVEDSLVVYEWLFNTINRDGYGDSTNLNPSEDGVVEDSLVVYEWLFNTINRDGQQPPLFVWGHLRYGDSTNLNPSEDGVVEDSLVVYEWLFNTINRDGQQPPLFVWGHSLGTGISSNLLGNLPDLSTRLLSRESPLPPPSGLILESPFNNLADEVAQHPLSKLVTWLPYYESTFVAPFRTAPEHTFRSDIHLTKARNLPILILHAKDDIIVPFRVGLKLYRSILASRSSGGALVKLHAYDKTLGLGHKWICNAKDLPYVIGEFVKDHR